MGLGRILGNGAGSASQPANLPPWRINHAHAVAPAADGDHLVATLVKAARARERTRRLQLEAPT